MAERPATLEEVARRAGVSAMTASRLINHDPQAKEENRQKMLAAFDALGYQPNAQGRIEK